MLASIGGATTPAQVAACVAKSGGAAPGGGVNTLLEADIKDMRVEGVMGPPKLVVDGVRYEGRLDCPSPLRLQTCGVLGSICAAIPEARRGAVPACTDSYWGGETRSRAIVGKAAAEGTRAVGTLVQSYAAHHHISTARAQARAKAKAQLRGGETAKHAAVSGWLWPASAGSLLFVALLIGWRSRSSAQMLYSPVPDEVGMTSF